MRAIEVALAGFASPSRKTIRLSSSKGEVETEIRALSQTSRGAKIILNVNVLAVF
jgi:hypothetical protein